MSEKKPTLKDFAEESGIKYNLAKQWHARGRIIETPSGYTIAEKVTKPGKTTKTVTKETVTEAIPSESVTFSLVTENEKLQNEVARLQDDVTFLRQRVTFLESELSEERRESVAESGYGEELAATENYTRKEFFAQLDALAYRRAGVRANPGWIEALLSQRKVKPDALGLYSAAQLAKLETLIEESV